MKTFRYTMLFLAGAAYAVAFVLMLHYAVNYFESL